MNRMRKCNDEAYQLAKDQALVKKLKNKRFRPFCLCLTEVQDYDFLWVQIPSREEQKFDSSKI